MHTVSQTSRFTHAYPPATPATQTKTARTAFGALEPQSRSKLQLHNPSFHSHTRRKGRVWGRATWQVRLPRKVRGMDRLGSSSRRGYGKKALTLDIIAVLTGSVPAFRCQHLSAKANVHEGSWTGARCQTRLVSWYKVSTVCFSSRTENDTIIIREEESGSG